VRRVLVRLRVAHGCLEEHAEQDVIAEYVLLIYLWMTRCLESVRVWLGKWHSGVVWCGEEM